MVGRTVSRVKKVATTTASEEEKEEEENKQQKQTHDIGVENTQDKDPITSLSPEDLTSSPVVDLSSSSPPPDHTDNLKKQGLQLHAVLTITQVLDILQRKGRIDQQTGEKVRQFIKDNQVPVTSPSPSPPIESKPVPRLSYAERAKLAKNIAAQKLFNIMEVGYITQTQSMHFFICVTEQWYIYPYDVV